MSTESMEDRIRRRAYELWEQDASPAGRADEYWDRAQKQIEAEGEIGADAPPVPEDQSASREKPGEAREDEDDESRTEGR
jgi:hypothetical protein